MAVTTYWQYSSNLLIDPTSVLAFIFFLTYAQETRHVMVQKPTECVSGAEGVEKRDSAVYVLLQSCELIDDSIKRYWLESASAQPLLQGNKARPNIPFVLYTYSINSRPWRLFQTSDTSSTDHLQFTT